MDPNNLQGGMYSTMGSGMLGLEMSLHHRPQNQSQPNQNPQNHSLLGQKAQNPHPQIGNYLTQDPNFRNHNRQFPHKSTRPQVLAISDEDDTGLGPEDSEGKKKEGSSPWQRMKWTDNMVRLLILVVYYIGDEAAPEGGEGKKKGGMSGGMLLKKGKWKSVSRAMMEKGFSVSPQQCEDKFNDLNKRYKRVNDILGKGTACKVVENQSLLDTMDNLTAKKKNEVKKLLNSKHLFFREMCAYHTSCASGSGGGGGSNGVAPSELPEEPAPGQRMGCQHSSENASIGVFSDRKEVEETQGMKKGSREEEMGENDESDRNEEDDDEDNTEYDEECSRKRVKSGFLVESAFVQQLNGEMASVVQDMSKSSVEKKQWVKNRMMQLEEKRVGFQLEDLELQKQRLKWLKFSSKKEREMERQKIQNKRARLENERMLLLLRHKEFELFDDI